MWNVPDQHMLRNLLRSAEGASPARMADVYVALVMGASMWRCWVVLTELKCRCCIALRLPTDWRAVVSCAGPIP